MRKSCQFLLIIEQRNCINIRYFGEAKNWPKVENDFIKEQSKCEGSPCTWMIDKISTSNGKIDAFCCCSSTATWNIRLAKKAKNPEENFQRKKFWPLFYSSSAPSSKWASCLRNGIVNKLYIFWLSTFCMERCCAIMQSCKFCKFCTHPQFVKLQVQGYKVATLILRSFILTPVHLQNPSDGSIFWFFDIL